MSDLDKKLRDLGKIARAAPPPAVDVSAQVLRTLAVQPAKLDVLPVAFAGGAVVVAALACLVCLPSWQIMLEPWAGFFPK